MTPGRPRIIQGGMGAGVSGWRLARAVSCAGQLGVVSGTALDAIIARRLQLGDAGGHVRRALESFPWPDVVARVLDTYFVPGGIPASASCRPTPLPTLHMTRPATELLVVANFVEVTLAKEGHGHPVGINYLEKIQLPTLAALFGALLAGVDYVLMGAGLPMAIPGVLDRLVRWEPAEMRIRVAGDDPEVVTAIHLDPTSFGPAPERPLSRPQFLPIVASNIAARTLLRGATGSIEGFVVEGHTAGGHNAPPRRRLGGEPTNGSPFGPRDVPDLAKFRALGKPFWLAGGYASPDMLAEAQRQGAAGIQVGTVFAFCEESGSAPGIKAEVLRRCRAGELRVRTDFEASPTGYPFKLIELPGITSVGGGSVARRRVCDLGYLRELFRTPDGKVGYRCPGEPVAAYLAKGGKLEDTVGKQCLCNGLLATIGLAQMRGGLPEAPIVTAGEDFSFLPHLAVGATGGYTANDVLSYLGVAPV